MDKPNAGAGSKPNSSGFNFKENQHSHMSKHLATVARKNSLLTGRNLRTRLRVGEHLPRPVGEERKERKDRREKHNEGPGLESVIRTSTGPDYL